MKKKLINFSPLKNFENTFKIEQFHPKSDRSVIRATTVRHPIPITFREKEKEGITKKRNVITDITTLQTKTDRCTRPPLLVQRIFKSGRAAIDRKR